jgi:acylphosphatase
MKKAVKLIITGTVQGVFFRQFIKENADKLKLRGFARNSESGDVEVVAEGNSQEVDSMIEICRKGPKFASIREIKVEDKKYSGDYKDFRVLRF